MLTEARICQIMSEVNMDAKPEWMHRDDVLVAIKQALKEHRELIADWLVNSRIWTKELWTYKDIRTGNIITTSEADVTYVLSEQLRNKP